MAWWSSKFEEGIGEKGMWGKNVSGGDSAKIPLSGSAKGHNRCKKLNLWRNPNNPEAEGGEGMSLRFHKLSWELIAEQKADTDFELLYARVGANSGEDKPCQYYLKDGMLMRRWKAPRTEDTGKWNVCEQLVMPLKYRKELMNTAHEAPMAGHLGIAKTFLRLTKNFYWPGIRGDVKKFCEICQWDRKT